MERHAGAAPALSAWKAGVLAVTPMAPNEKEMAAAGIAPASPRLQRGANLSQLNSRWSLHEVTLPGRPVINRLLYF